MSFDIGQKVVCADDVFSPSVIKLLQQFPVKDKTYVVRDVKIGFLPVNPAKQREGGVRVLLVGLSNPNADDGQEHGFNAERFRPLDEVKESNRAFDKLMDEDCEKVLAQVVYGVGKINEMPD